MSSDILETVLSNEQWQTIDPNIREKLQTFFLLQEQQRASLAVQHAEIQKKSGKCFSQFKKKLHFLNLVKQVNHSYSLSLNHKWSSMYFKNSLVLWGFNKVVLYVKLFIFITQ